MNHPCKNTDILQSRSMATHALDRISNLPINVLHLILERLPLHDAARTTTLSKTWRIVRESQAELVFDHVFFSHLVTKKHKQASEVSSIISNILLVHSVPVSKFHLSTPKDLPLIHIDLWIKNISNTGVRVLELFYKPLSAYKMPSYLFSCSQLTHLTLDNCILDPPPRFRGFCNLICARLLDVNIKADMSFGTQLQKLEMVYCTGIKYLRGQFESNNNIRNLMICYCGKINWRWFKCTREIKTLVLTLGESLYLRKNVVNLDKVVGSMPKIQFLFLVGVFFKCVEPGASVLKRLTTTMENLIFLQLHVEFCDLVQIHSVICLIRSSPNLQDLRIRLESVDSTESLTVSRVEECLKLPNLDDLIHDKLETVAILGTVVSRSEFHFIKLLLASSPSLKWMKLSKSATIDDPKEELRILGEVTRLPRASPVAQIIWT